MAEAEVHTVLEALDCMSGYHKVASLSDHGYIFPGPPTFGSLPSHASGLRRKYNPTVLWTTELIGIVFTQGLVY